MLKCKVCGTEFPAIKERHYIAKDNSRTGAIAIVSKDEEKIYDSYNCPICGSQVIAQERKRLFEPEYDFGFDDDSETEGEDDEMISYNIDSAQSAVKLIHLCERYRHSMDIDVIYGRYVIDGCSMLGVHSLIGHTVTLEPQTDDKNLLEEFKKDLEYIKYE